MLAVVQAKLYAAWHPEKTGYVSGVEPIEASRPYPLR